MAIDVAELGNDRTIEMYISPTCPYCMQAMEHYDERGVKYVVHDAQNDLAERKRMFEYTNSDPTVPAIVVDGQYVQSGWGRPPRG